ncbi:MAG: ABC transporter permease, partial [Blastocatellia bacterium]
MAEIAQDVRHAARLLLKDPGVTAIALLALALGIGANTVIFTAFDAVMLSHLPYQDPDHIAMVWDSFPKEGIKKFGVSFGNVADWRQQNHVFEDIAVYEALSNTAFNLTGGTGPERVQGTLASAGFFRVLGVEPLQGRAIREQDEERGRNHVALISYRLWQNYYG